ncbi:NADH:ubiquinone oxidoreductase [Tilletia horrida]|nr:NADH:ubiquinone oxidoreductase [Tilletia horrida]
MGYDDNDDIPSFSSPEDEVRYWKSKVNDLHDTLNETEATLQDFMESSKELEAEMEREISASNRKQADLQNKNEALRADVDTWKSKYQSSLAEHNKTLADLNKEVEVLRESHNIYKTKVRDMELVNDELESAERMVQSSLVDMEGRYNKAIERTALLEEELVTKATLEEENQRLKDEIRELNEELAVVRNMTPSISRAQSRSDGPAAVADDIHASIEADLNLSDLVVNRPMSSASSASVGQQSATSATARAERAMSPNATVNSINKPRTAPISAQARPSHLSHSRRGSRDLRGLTMHEPVSAGGAPRASGTTSSSSRTLQSTRLTRPLGTTSTRRSGVAPAGSSGGAQRMVQDMMARMKTLETRINSARNLSRLPQSTLASSTSSRYGLGDAPSAIPRPSSRLGNSTGPGAAAAAAASANNYTPRASLSRRDSLDGRPSGSAIPIPSGGLARSTLGPRPSSRLSNAGRDTPPLPNNGAVSPSDEQFFSTGTINGGLYHSSASGSHSGHGGAGPVLNRKRSATGGSHLGAKPRGSGSALPLPSNAMLKTSLGGAAPSRLSTGMMGDRDGSDSGHHQDGGSSGGGKYGRAAGGVAGPPSSWMTRIGATPAQAAGAGNGAAGAGSASSTAAAATGQGISARPRSSSGARPGYGGSSLRR